MHILRLMMLLSVMLLMLLMLLMLVLPVMLQEKHSRPSLSRFLVSEINLISALLVFAAKFFVFIQFSCEINQFQFASG